MKFRFKKYHGCGNDFIIINNLDNQLKFSTEFIKQICDRHFGIGADGLILVEKQNNNYFMNYYNADGSKAEMCGNGLRCTADFIYNEIDSSTKTFPIICRDGIHNIKINSNNIEVTVSKPNFSEENTNKDLESSLKNNNLIKDFGLVNVGNPHLILVLDNLDDLSENFCEILSKEYLPNGVNVNLVKKLNENSIQVKTYERGDGFTLACGTGACASVSFLNKINQCDKEILVKIPGGNLWVNLKENGVLLAGEAINVFDGEFSILD